MSKYPLKQMADAVESHGRFGDTELVHLNPIEVAGLAALSPTGKLTINPVTGKKEAFLPLLIPIMASYGGSALAASAGAGVIGAAIAGGAASGMATYAQTGDAERGLYSGIMGAGVGAASGAAGAAARGAGEGAMTEGIAAAGVDSVGQGSNTLLGDLAAEQAAQQAATQGVGSATTIPLAGEQALPNAMNMPPPTAEPSGNMFMTGEGALDQSYGQTLQDPWQAPEGEGMINQAIKPQAMMPMAMGANQLMEMEAQDKQNSLDKEEEEKRKKKLQQAYNDLQGAYRRAQPDTRSGLSEARKRMSKNMPKPWSPDGMAEGGITNIKRMWAGGISTGGSGGSGGGLTTWKYKDYLAQAGIRPLGDMQSRNHDYLSNQPARGLNGTQTGNRGGGGSGEGGGRSGPTGGYTPYNPNDSVGYGSQGNGYGGIDPVSVQANLRGEHHVATTPGYMAGMQPEFNYFQDDLENIQVPQGFSQEELMAPYNTGINKSQIDPQSDPYFQSVIPKKGGKPEGMAAGGQVPIQMGGEEAMINGGGIAEVPTDYNQPMPPPQAPNMQMPQAGPEAGGQPSEQDITLLASALMGENPEHADKIVEAFVSQYGPEKFAEIRTQILQMIQGPNAQTEGMIQGQGGGMDDQVMGTIGGEQPVAVSPGEYIVPADVVSGLGDGSSDAGAAELDQMQSNVRMARGGGTNQPPAIDARKVMPA